MNLSALLGNERLKHTLEHTRTLPHAILIGGSKGSGRHTLAGLLSRYLVCDHPENAPCMTCVNCRRVEEGIHPDVIDISRFLSPEEREKDLRVDAIRALRQDAYVRPNQAESKVYIISRADTMNPNAQNALLKVLEDGPSYSVFLLIAENPSSLLETIRSRCVRYDLTPLSRQETETELFRRYPQRDRQELLRAAARCEGCLGQAIEALTGKTEPDPAGGELVERLAEALSRNSELAVMEWAAGIQTGKPSRDQLRAFYRQLQTELVDALGGGESRWSAFSREQLMAMARLIPQGQSAVERNVSAAHNGGWLAVSLWEILSEK